MADLTQTAANVAVGDLTGVQLVTAGEAITQGMPVYRKSLDGYYYQTDADAADTADVAGIAVTPAGASADKFVLATNRSRGTADVNLGATLTQGETYVVSSNKGKIAPISDLTTGDYVSYIGVASSTSILKLKTNATGVAKP